VLGYHRIADEQDLLAVTPQRFRQQIETMLEAGLVATDLTSALEAPCSPDGSNRFCVTFDDGYLDVMLNAVPILEELRVPAVMYVSSWAVCGAVRFPWYEWQPQMMGWDELRELVAHPLFELGAHGRTHALLPYLAAHQAAKEISGSRSDLEQQLAAPVRSFCYPAGLYREREVVLAQEAGFTTAVTTDPGVITQGTRPHAIPRTMIGAYDDMELFSAKISGVLDTRTHLERILFRRRRSAALLEASIT
jgi:peptidoglycan/xylan/chitin deacetylase (PgdA/CDA1 family)